MTDDEVLWLDEHRVVSLAELVEVSGLSEPELLDLVQVGAIPVREARGAAYTFSARVVTVARTAGRLRNDFELDTRGLGVALRLLERVSDLEREIGRLRAQLPRE
ncbi:MAG: chaperone modulator CbpM [Pseudomonadota bacterium]